MAKGNSTKPDFVQVNKNPVKGVIMPINETLSPVDRGADFVKPNETVKTSHGYKP